MPSFGCRSDLLNDVPLISGRPASVQVCARAVFVAGSDADRTLELEGSEDGCDHEGWAGGGSPSARSIGLVPVAVRAPKHVGAPGQAGCGAPQPAHGYRSDGAKTRRYPARSPEFLVRSNPHGRHESLPRIDRYVAASFFTTGAETPWPIACWLRVCTLLAGLDSFAQMAAEPLLKTRSFRP